MSLYEALDQFVGVGLLACAGVVGCELSAATPFDGGQLSRFLRERRMGEEFGQVLDALAHEIWLAQDQRGFPQRVCEGHAAALAELMAELRLSPIELAAGITAARTAIGGQTGSNQIAGGQARTILTEAWIQRARTDGRLLKAGLIEDIARFLLEQLFHHLIERPQLMNALKPALAEFKATVEVAAQTAAPPAAHPAAAPAAAPAPGTLRPPAPVENVPVPMPVTGAVLEIGRRHGVPEPALRRFQAILASQAMTSEQRLARLDELAGWLAATIAHLSRPANESPDLTRLKSAAAAALAAGDLERAMSLLQEVRARLRDDRRRTEARLAEEIETLRLQMIEEAAAAARLAELALARCDHLAAAELFADAAGNLPVSERALELDYRQRQAESLAGRAELTGDATALSSAADAFRRALALVDRQADPTAWARINVGLGDMLMALGTRAPATGAELPQAAAAYGEAIAVIDKVAHPTRWALVQLSRAAALIELGQRGDRDRHWMAAAQALIPALDVFEARGARDLAEAARAKLRSVHGALEPALRALPLPARSA